jgi:hypothetical protein
VRWGEIHLCIFITERKNTTATPPPTKNH